MFICSECGYKNKHNVTCCLVCGSLLDYSTSALRSTSTGDEQYYTHHRAGFLPANLELTFSIGRSRVSVPFPRGAYMVLGRHAQSKNGDVDPYIDPLHDSLYFSKLRGTPISLPEPIEFLSLVAYGAAEQGVSREHVVLRHEGDYLTIEDLGSLNGTFVNGQRLCAGECQLLNHNDEIHLGYLRMIVRYNRQLAMAG